MAQPQKRDSDNCKVLSVVWYKVFPAKFGGQKAVAHFNEALAEKVELTCICSAKNSAASNSTYKVLNCLPISSLQFLSPSAWLKILETAKNQQATHLLLEFPYYGLLGIFFKSFYGKKLVVNTHNIEYVRFRELGKWWWPLLYVLEKWTLRQADLVFFKTTSDLLHAEKKFRLYNHKLSLIPYGATKQEVTGKEEARNIITQRLRITQKEKILLFAGTLDYLPNADAVRWISKNLVPLLLQRNFSFKIVICGRLEYSSFQELKGLQSDTIFFAGDVDDISNYFLSADVFINPVKTGGGIQTKIMDALSYHLNVVCFRSKCKDILHAENKLYSVPVDDLNRFADAVITAADEKSSTPDAFFETYNWRSIAAKAAQEICSL